MELELQKNTDTRDQGGEGIMSVDLGSLPQPPESELYECPSSSS